MREAADLRDDGAQGRMLGAIASWQLDAERDDAARYYLDPPGLAAVAEGEVALILGARGAGKTALAERFLAQETDARVATRLALKDAVAAALRRQGAGGERTADGEGAARLVILIAAFEAMIDRRLVRGSAIRTLAKLFALDVGPRVEATLPQIVNRNIVIEIFGSRPGEGERAPLMEGLERLEAALAPVLAGRRVFVFVDEAAEERDERGALDPLKVDVLADLLHAAATLPPADRGAPVAPVILARPEVFARLPESERRGWAERRLDLRWTEETLMRAAGFRAARAASADFTEAEINAPAFLRRVYRGAARMMADEDPRRESVWPYIWRRTRATPRDMVHHMKVSAAAARAAKRDDVDARALAHAARAHALYMRRAMADDLAVDFADPDAMLGALGALGARTGDFVRLQAALETALREAGQADVTHEVARAIERLFAVSALGVATHDGRRAVEAYRCTDPALEIDPRDPIVAHPALADALGLRDR